MSRFEPVNGRSQLSLVGESSIHPLQTVSTSLGGYFEATLDENGQIDFASPVAGEVEVLIESLKSNNALIDREMRNRLQTRRYPKVVGKLLEVRPQSEAGSYWASGDLTFHGVTRRTENLLRIQLLDASMIEIQGQMTIDVRDFNLEPPKLLMLRVYPDVKVNLSFVLKQVQ